MDRMSTIRRGLIAALPVCLVATTVILLRADAIEAATGGSENELGGGSATGWMVTWTIITLAFGVVSTAAFDYLVKEWDWTGAEYLSFALSIAVALSALAFLRVYSGEMHPYRIEYSALNFAYAFGFGCAVPTLARGSAERRLLKTEVHPISQ